MYASRTDLRARPQAIRHAQTCRRVALGDTKHNKGFTHFHRRGRMKVRTEFRLLMMGPQPHQGPPPPGSHRGALNRRAGGRTPLTERPSPKTLPPATARLRPARVGATASTTARRLRVPSVDARCARIRGSQRRGRQELRRRDQLRGRQRFEPLAETIRPRCALSMVDSKVRGGVHHRGPRSRRSLSTTALCHEHSSRRPAQPGPRTRSHGVLRAGSPPRALAAASTSARAETDRR
jgi:hypothetical protein